MHTTYRPTRMWIPRSETRRDEESHGHDGRDGRGERRGRAAEAQANELARARSRHAAAVWRQGSPCSLKQSRRMPPTLADRPIVPFSNLPASREPALLYLSFLPTRVPARPSSSSPHPARQMQQPASATTHRFDGSTTETSRRPYSAKWKFQIVSSTNY